MAQTAVPPVEAYLALVRRRRLMGAILLALFVVALWSGFQTVNARSAGGFWSGLPQILDFPRNLVLEAWERRDRMPGHMARAVPALIETINIAAVATLAGALMGMGLALLSTRGLAPWPGGVALFRRVMDVLRAVPEIVIALILIFVLGGGPVPAMIAIALHTAGALGKLFSEVAEAADLRPVEGLASTGANWGQRMALAVMPQVAPNWLSYGLLRFEINIRASAILGFVGAGGIGYELRNAMTFGQGRFDVAAAIFLVLFLTIVVVDQLSDRLRRRLTHGAAA
ncbi:phosphonate ABC transporter, permease protein PhnE [Rubellimicrobium sp. CFH 75288]|uniref:phosphonate ABC transporter, permease protein PhnE n=1 Tax=Rubellimicrobium sp. CFH 75288 TaxID=2697034 RepID=UPI001411FB6F|nr:phosphonate ABC transporter, permease protein PhnE [Rubellimicrobium sp. CFH 75288]NAZ36494.1 phosphonate ABC transporter, permease protein PhnE [Rubellimicrobium sp. CFH 75288]